MLTRSFVSVFIMDCTYKINKYKIPLLNIIGITCFNTSFYSGFIFLKKESTENYVWALEMFKNILWQENQQSVLITYRELTLMNVIPIIFSSTTHILCVWHINKNILVKCKKFFKTQEGWDKFFVRLEKYHVLNNRR
jgi:MULE transposase domain